MSGEADRGSRVLQETHAFPDADALAAAVASRIAALAGQGIMARGAFHWALAGGATPRRCYQLLRRMDIDWRHVYIWFGDERCLPVGDAERNDGMADAVLLRHVPVPSAQVHSIPAELGPEQAAANYAKLLRQAPPLDLALLGMGEDGHTASLFPGNPALEDKRLAVPVFAAPKPPCERVSMGYSVLNGAARRIVMVAGAGKSDAFMRIGRGERLPAARLSESEWYVDAGTVRNAV